MILFLNKKISKINNLFYYNNIKTYVLKNKIYIFQTMMLITIKNN